LLLFFNLNIFFNESPNLSKIKVKIFCLIKKN